MTVTVNASIAPAHAELGVDERRADILRERARIKAIQTCAEARGRGRLARYISLESDLTAEEARSILAASPKGTGLCIFHRNEFPDDASALVKAIISYFPKSQRVKLLKIKTVIG